jgi:hypothetical protein
MFNQAFLDTLAFKVENKLENGSGQNINPKQKAKKGESLRAWD